MASYLFAIALFLVLATTSTAINITRILDQFPDTYGSFNGLLQATKLTEEINTRMTVTVLALDNDSIDTLSGRPIDEVKKILSNHVILDYFDVIKLKELKTKKSTVVTTLYQTTGMAQNSQGFLNISVASSGEIMFGSAVKNSPLNSKLLGSVMNRPYNVSVLQVSEPIIALGFDNGPLAAPPPPKNDTNATTTATKKAPPPENDTNATTTATKKAPPPENDTNATTTATKKAPPPPKNDTNATTAATKKAPAPVPLESDDAVANAPADSPADAPAQAEALTPASDSPADAPAQAEAPTPTADSPAADSPVADAPVADAPAHDEKPADKSEPPSESGSSKIFVGSGIGVAVVLALMGF